MPNDQKQAKTDDTQSQPTSIPPVLIQEDILPPMPSLSEDKTPLSGVAQDVVNPSPVVDSGSAAPADDIKIDTVMPAVVISGPKKKFAGGKVIATILGLFLLVGGVGAGVFLTGQNQNINEQAGGGCGTNTTQSSCNSSCSPLKGDPKKSYECKWYSQSDSCGESGQECGGGGGGGGEEITAGNCSSSQTEGAGWFQCGSGTGGSECTFCLKVANRTCNQVLEERQCYNVTGGNCSTITGSVQTYYCKGEEGIGSTGGVPNGCQRKDPLPSGVGWNGTSKTITGSFCGIVQVDADNQSGFCSRTDDSGCNTNPPPTTPPTVPPTIAPTPTAPAITASCQTIKAYSPTWTELTVTQLGALRAGSVVNFCATGTATGGSFDKAIFKINGVQMPETTAVRPGSTDFCQSYTIPALSAGTTRFEVKAQLNHVSLGWKPKII